MAGSTRSGGAPRLPRRAAAALVLALCCGLPACAGLASGAPAPITPDFARMLFDQIRVLNEGDGCRLTRFDTNADGIAIALQAPSGGEYAVEVATQSRRPDARWVGHWSVTTATGLEDQCAATFAAVRGVLEKTLPPSGPSWRERAWQALGSNNDLLAAQFVVLILGSLYILYREIGTQRPPPAAVLTVALVWAVGLALRLSMSPRTFLHEYFHIAETVAGYMGGYAAPGYGQTGAALVRFVGTVLGRPDDVQVIFLTNAVLASLAVPAVAALDLVLVGSWPHAICAAILLCVLPQHLRYSAAEDMFIQAVTFALWTLALWALYVRRPRVTVAIIAAVALSIAVQTRPEMLFLPAAVLAMVLLVQASAWRLLFDWRTVVAALLAAMLLIPRALDMRRVLGSGSTPTLTLPDWSRYFENLILFNRDVTPPIFWMLVAAGALWTARRKPGLLAWVVLVFAGWTFFSRLLGGGNLLFDIRTQLLPTSFVVLIAAGAASLWIEAWGARRRETARRVGGVALVATAVAMIVPYRGFVTELRDQQLEWAFLERTVRQLPERGTLLSAIGVGGINLDAFPEFLLQRDGKQYQLVDLREAADGSVSWPSAGEDLLYYQGMFCHYAFPDSEPTPDPMTARCQAVHDRYVAEPLFVEDLDTTAYSLLRYAHGGQGPFRIGFYRLTANR